MQCRHHAIIIDKVDEQMIVFAWLDVVMLL